MYEVIKVHNLSFRYLGSPNYTLKNINFSIKRGEFVLLVGASGCGKTTLARAIVGLIPQFYEGEYSGYVEVLGMNAAKTPISRITARVGFLFQNPENQIFMNTVERDIAFGLEIRGYPPSVIKELVRWVLGVMNMNYLAQRRVEELSGGEKQKLAIASLLVLKPEVLILDEPLAYLSPAMAHSFVDFLAHLNVNHSVTILLIDHRLDLVSRVANRLMVMKEGELVVDLPIREAYKRGLYKEYGINVPTLIKVYEGLKKKGINIDPPLSMEEVISLLTHSRHVKPHD